MPLYKKDATETAAAPISGPYQSGGERRATLTWQQQMDEARRFYPVGAVYLTTQVGQCRDRVTGHAWRRGVGVIILMEALCALPYRHWMRLKMLARCKREAA